eukprot:CAMPEP_0195112536 /NCGR_PEP_ID=MMETSP0448-20130528/99383_1 /TAXON_ID=66468 /ORGANISM="Heterocapsa triquestra, Strain CCMP 448" /LENGTH=103 /DNA_ID=CAMNT_0040149393 /DNA_START=58 /DNA_END=365 /DNA_ORIENTATION=-
MDSDACSSSSSGASDSEEEASSREADSCRKARARSRSLGRTVIMLLLHAATLKSYAQLGMTVGDPAVCGESQNSMLAGAVCAWLGALMQLGLGTMPLQSIGIL